MARSRRVALLVDHPQRDLPGLTLIAHRLAALGAEAFLVPFNLQVQELAALAPDFILCNYLRKNNQRSVREYLADGIQVGVLPTEGGVFAALPDDAWSTTLRTASGQAVDARWRTYALTMSDDAEARRGIRRYCAWSAGFKAYAAEAGWYAPEQTVVCGAPRLDFYAPRWRAAALARAPYVAACRDPLVLINGSFSLINPRFQTPEQEARQLVERFGFHPEFVASLCQQMQRALTGMIELTNGLARRFPDVTFVYRPHPFENPDLYSGRLERRSNLMLEKRGTVDEWLIRARALLHWRSSTAIEAGLLGIPAFQASWLLNETPVPMVDPISHGVASAEELAGALEASLRGELPETPGLAADRARIAAEVYGYTDGRSHERVAAEILGSLEADASAPSWRICERVAAQLDLSRSWSDSLAAWDRGDKAYRVEDVKQILGAIAAASGTPADAFSVESSVRAGAYRFRSTGFRSTEGRSIRVAAAIPARSSRAVPRPDRADDPLERAQRTYRSGALEEAAELCQLALRVRPNDPEAWRLAARLSQAFGQDETAEVAWRQVLTFRFGDQEALETLAKLRATPASSPRVPEASPHPAVRPAAPPADWKAWLADPRWFEAPVHCRGSVRANVLGLQPARQLLHRVEFGHFYRPRSHAERALARDGIAVIHDFFPERVFAEIERSWRALAASPRARVTRDKDGTGIDWTTAPIAADGPGRAIAAAFARDPRVRDMARFVTRLPADAPPPLLLQSLALPPGRRDDIDRETALHVDRHYPCVKACFYINDNEAANGAYVFCPGSHRLTWRRMLFDYHYSVQHQRWKEGLEVSHPWVEMQRGRPVASDAARAFLGIREVQQAYPRNTLVLSNNMGFHRRGQIQPGHVRQQIRILFYQELQPWAGRLLRRLRQGQ